MNKPNGQYMVPQEEKRILEFVSKLPIRKVPGIGRVSERILEAFGIKTCGDLYDNLVYLERIFSPIRFEFLMRTSIGLSTYSSSSSEGRKGISAEQTFSAMTQESDMLDVLKELSISLAQDMEKENIKGKTVTLKFKTTEFKVSTRSKTLDSFVFKGQDIYKQAKNVIDFVT